MVLLCSYYFCLLHGYDVPCHSFRLTVSCRENESPCEDGLACVPDDYRCDYFSDCNDNSDEADCVCDTDTEFQCLSGGCISISMKCDDFEDCFDYSDESINTCGESFFLSVPRNPIVYTVCLKKTNQQTNKRNTSLTIIIETLQIHVVARYHFFLTIGAQSVEK